MDDFVDSHYGGRLDDWTSSFLRNWPKFLAGTEAKKGSFSLPRSILLQSFASMKRTASVQILGFQSLGPLLRKYILHKQTFLLSWVHFTTVVYKNRSTKTFWEMLRCASYPIVHQNLQRFLLICKTQSQSTKHLRFWIPSDLVRQRIITWICRFYHCMRRRNNNWCFCGFVWCFHMKNIAKKVKFRFDVIILHANWNTCVLSL